MECLTQIIKSLTKGDCTGVKINNGQGTNHWNRHRRCQGGHGQLFGWTLLRGACWDAGCAGSAAAILGQISHKLLQDHLAGHGGASCFGGASGGDLQGGDGCGEGRRGSRGGGCVSKQGQVSQQQQASAGMCTPACWPASKQTGQGRPGQARAGQGRAGQATGGKRGDSLVSAVVSALSEA